MWRDIDGISLFREAGKTQLEFLGIYEMASNRTVS